MRTFRLTAVLNMFLGVLLLAVGVVHFLMMGHLESLISSWVNPMVAYYMIAVFKINHFGSGIFLIVIGLILAYAGLGFWRGQGWGKFISLVVGLGLLVLSIILWRISPPMFLTAAPYKFALLSLGAVGVLACLPVVIFWRKLGKL